MNLISVSTWTEPIVPALPASPHHVFVAVPTFSVHPKLQNISFTTAAKKINLTLNKGSERSEYRRSKYSPSTTSQLNATLRKSIAGALMGADPEEIRPTLPPTRARS